MIKKILIANRSEIACRVIRACKELQITSVAVYSTADENSLHVKMADEAILIGEAPPTQSYLNQDKIISAAIKANCDAIHPGYGFLSENPDFNKKVRTAGLVFIGPNPEPMALLGSKVVSRQTMIEAGVPVIPGMRGSSKNIDDFLDMAEQIGFPVLIKASAGGGGKGMRVVRNREDMKTSVEAAMRESLSAFGSDEVYLEKYLESPRHIEFQVAADNYGNAVHIFERECSIQRRHQKIIEETPSTVMTPELRQAMGETAVKVIKTANYNNVGTVEFLVDKNRNFYFLEVNARIQVEHPITELVAGVDLVKLQIQIANNLPLPYKQEELTQRGHAIECRIYAEDAENNFMPSAGKILLFKEPSGSGVRYDSGIEQNSEVSVYYDPTLAKLIVLGANREEARQRMINALKQNIILGVKTSIGFMIKCLENPDFISGATFTSFIETHFNGYEPNQSNLNHAIFTALANAKQKENKNISFGAGSQSALSPWQTIGKWEICSSN